MRLLTNATTKTSATNTIKIMIISGVSSMTEGSVCGRLRGSGEEVGVDVGVGEGEAVGVGDGVWEGVGLGVGVGVAVGEG